MFVLVLAFALTLGVLVPMATPAPTAAVSPDVVISQVYGGGGNSGATLTNDFIELYNRGESAVDVSTWSVQYASATGTTWQQTNLTGSIAPGSYYLVQEAQGTGGTTALPTPDATGAIPMSATNGKAALLTNQTLLAGCGTAAVPCRVNPAIRDYVGYGTATEFEGSGATGALTNTTAAIRNNGGATDTDNNATDFTIGAPNPRNSGGGEELSGVGSADPSSLEAGDMTLLTVTVTPATNPASTGIAVTSDLAQIGGSATQPFFDDGTNGDATVGDLVFSLSASVAAATAPGLKELPAAISDAQGNEASTSISLTVQGEPVEIWEIQGVAHSSPLEGDFVFGVEGIVTFVRNNGFWMTDPTPDVGPGSEATSNGIFVFSGTTAKPALGDHVTVDGEVDEFRPNPATNLSITQLRSFTPATLISSGNLALPTIVIGVDRTPPGEIIEDDATTSVEATGVIFDPVNDGIDFWESLEGMRLSVADAVAVGPTNGFGEIAVVSQLTAAGLRTPRGGILVRELGPDGDYRPGDFNPERLILDDVLTPTPRVNTGDEFASDPVGVLDYGFGNFKLLITADAGRIDNGLTAEAGEDDTNRELSVATFNVENLSPRDTEGKVARLATQIVDSLRSPDIIAIEEVQDNTGPTNDGVVAADQSWQRLIDAIVAAGGPEYSYRQIDPQNNADGGAPGGNIRVGFLFLEEDGLTFIDRPGGDATTDTDVVRARRTARAVDEDGDGTLDRCGGSAALTISPGRIIDANLGGASAFNLTRKSLAGEFCFRGQTVFIVANHFSSKGDDRPLFGHFQPPFRLTEFQSGTPEDGWRHAQAQAVNDFVDEILAVDSHAHVIVLGDINDFDFSETVEVLSGERTALAGGADADGSGPTAETGARPILSTLFELLAPDERYSYVFDGNSQVLDQILVSNSLLLKGPSYDVLHVNAEFFDQASDHDPSVMTVKLGSAND